MREHVDEAVRKIRTHRGEMNPIRIETLSKDNYDTWRMQVEALLTKNDAWGYVSGEKIKPEVTDGDSTSRAAQEAWAIGDRKAKADFILSIHPSQLNQIRGCETAREVWIKLETIYASKGPARKVTLLKLLTLHPMTEDGDIRDHIQTFFDIVNKLDAMNIGINQDVLSIMLLHSLPASYENFRCAIESRDELPSPESLKVKIIEEYDARRQMHKPEAQGAMAANRVKWKPKTGKPDREEAGFNRPGKIALKCFRCHKTGHKAADCYVKLDENRNDVNKLDDTFVSYHVAEAMSLAQDNVDKTRDSG